METFVLLVTTAQVTAMLQHLALLVPTIQTQAVQMLMLACFAPLENTVIEMGWTITQMIVLRVRIIFFNSSAMTQMVRVHTLHILPSQKIVYRDGKHESLS